jgi:membrane associated rhomboid family serine protease
MHVALKTGMRKRLGLSFVLVRAAWVALPVTLVVGLAIATMLDYGWLARAAAIVGLVGALAFATFTADLVRRLVTQKA